MACSVRRCVTWRSIEEMLHRAAGSRGALLEASQDGGPAVTVDRLAFGISPDRLPRLDRPLTDRAGHRRAFRVRDAAVLTEHDVLSDLDRDTAHCAARKLNHPRDLRFFIYYNLSPESRRSRPTSTLE